MFVARTLLTMCYLPNMMSSKGESPSFSGNFSYPYHTLTGMCMHVYLCEIQIADSKNLYNIRLFIFFIEENYSPIDVLYWYLYPTYHSYFGTFVERSIIQCPYLRSSAVNCSYVLYKISITSFFSVHLLGWCRIAGQALGLCLCQRSAVSAKT